MQIVPEQVAAGERPAYSFNQFGDLGLLRYLNEKFFGPRGLLLCLDYADGAKEPCGWSLHGFQEAVKVVSLPAKKRIEYEATLKELIDLARKSGRAPIELEEAKED
jgi:hypothetical protein